MGNISYRYRCSPRVPLLNSLGDAPRPFGPSKLQVIHNKAIILVVFESTRNGFGRISEFRLKVARGRPAKVCPTPHPRRRRRDKAARESIMPRRAAAKPVTSTLPDFR